MSRLYFRSALSGSHTLALEEERSPAWHDDGMPPNTPLNDDATGHYQPYEYVIESWEQLQAEINRLGDAYPYEEFVWRGHADARWGLCSSLYRAVAAQLGLIPSEEDLVAAERRLLKLARREWRLDGIPALPLFAHMQHVGVPTRLLDATFNPLIAAWFAIDATSHAAEADGRLFAFTVREQFQLNSRWSGNTPRWHPGYLRPKEWGTGLGRRVWQPPALHSRIPAQNAVFLVDGVPTDGPPHALTRLDPDDASTWTASELRTIASIPVRLGRISTRPLSESKGIVFTYRITARAKSSIRRQLENRFGYSFATIYADIEGLARYLQLRPDQLVGGGPTSTIDRRKGER